MNHLTSAFYTVKTDAKLRLALAGPPGSGKTFTALSLAHALADGQGVAVIDTEHGSASKYADLFPPFDCVNLDSFHPDLYVEAIKAAERAELCGAADRQPQPRLEWQGRAAGDRRWHCQADEKRQYLRRLG